LKPAPPDARQYPRFYARAIASRCYAIFWWNGFAGQVVHIGSVGDRLNPNGRRVAKFAVPRHAFANLKRFQIRLI
jgi:hypothetical protein